MMMSIGNVLLLLLFCCHNTCNLAKSQPTKVKSRRAFYGTQYGQIHYKYGGDFSRKSLAPRYTFLLFHGNPRSIDEFQELVHELNTRFTAPEIDSTFSFIAMDLLGEGQSDDPITDSSNDYVSMQQYAEYMIEIATSVLSMTSSNMNNCNFLSTRYLIPLGSLTGTAIATELSYQLMAKNRSHSLCSAEKCEVLTTILHDPMYYFSDQIVANVHSYAHQQQNWQPKENGEHLLDIWNDANYQPYKDLALQDRKSLDRFRAAVTQWQVILSYANYSSQYLLSRLIDLSKVTASACGEDFHAKSSVPPLIILYGEDFINDPMMDKLFEIHKMRLMIANATQGGSYEEVIVGGNQAALSQNVTTVADIIIKQVVKLC